MKQVLLDTNFILTCMKQKIDFFDEIPVMGIKIIIPQNVLDELQKLKKSSALKLMEQEKANFVKLFLAGKNVDNSIIRYAKENKDLIIATLDKGIQKKIKNKKLIIRDKKQLEII